MMKIARARAGARILGVVAAAGILAGCGGGGAQPAFAPSGVNLSAALRSAHAASASPDAREHKLIYVSDSGFNVVWEFKLPSGKEIGELTGFEEPQGMCSSGGHWWVANTEESTIEEYAAGGTSPIATFDDPGQYPVGCSYDEKTKSLAVTNIITTQDGEGSLAVYKNGSGTPTTYTCSNLYRYYFAGYDEKGDLFVDGESSSYGFGFCELPAGSSTLKDITLNQSIEFPGEVQWDGTYVAIEDQDTGTIGRFKVVGSKGTLEGEVQFSDGCSPFWIDGHRIYCFGDDALQVYAYPAGGSPIKTIAIELSEPTAFAIVKYRP